jgi:hypothetical protein
MDSSVPDQLVNHITRYFKQGVSEDKIRKVMQQNDLADGMLDEAIAAVQAVLAAEAAAKAKAEAEAKAAKEAAREAAKAKELAAKEAQKLKEAAKRKKQDTKKSLHKPSVHIKHDSDELEMGAEALPQDTAISLHSPAKKSELEPLPLDEDDISEEDTDGLLVNASDDDIPQKDSAQSKQAEQSSETAPAELTFAEELLRLQQSEKQLADQQPLSQAGQAGQVIQTPFMVNTPGSLEPSMQQHAPTAPSSAYAGVFGAGPVEANKYTLRQAVPDSLLAARANLATYLTTVGMAFGVGVTTLILTALAISKFFTLPYSVLLTTPTKILISIVGSIVLYALWAIIAGAFSLTIASLALFDSSQKHKTSINTVMAKSFKRIKRITVATAALLTAAFLPMALVALVPVVVVALRGAHTLAYAQPTLYLAAFGWAVFIVMRFGLVPYVALFERAAPLKKSMVRSKELLDGSGQWFVAQAMATIAAFALILALLVHYRPQAISHPLNIVIDLILLLAILVANGAMVMLYCNRKLFKG